MNIKEIIKNIDLKSHFKMPIFIILIVYTLSLNIVLAVKWYMVIVLAMIFIDFLFSIIANKMKKSL